MTIGTALFSDRIINIAVTGPLVRLELGIQEPPKSEGQQAQIVPSLTIVMPLDGLIASMAMLEGMMRQLLKDGVIKRQPPPAAPQGESTSSVK